MADKHEMAAPALGGRCTIGFFGRRPEENERGSGSSISVPTSKAFRVVEARFAGWGEGE